ncbi:putative ornithine cyclodeaminase, mu-crystallin [Polaromonas sp. CF318]|uniref:ornithine cyclodeaminase family protein n=1 Tax=Polaromonas sp. CF318 TaxID=1144318 RepID=UPI0002712E05|nr:putative ornithine cyclodeaminase, mu-crystallin [Polaromonas sp. CF318]
MLDESQTPAAKPHPASFGHAAPNATLPADAQLLLLDKHAVEAMLLPADVLEATREAFVLHSRREGRVFSLVRERLATGGVFGIKSGDVGAQSLLGFKAAGFWPGNPGRGADAHQATIMLLDPATGRPTCLIDGNAVTTERTGAAGGLGLQLARQDSHTVCVFGTGVQAQAQLRFALRQLPGLRQVLYATADGGPKPAFEAMFAGQCAIAHAADVNAAVAQSDVLITATTGKGPLFDLAAVQPGTHINAVGSDTKGKRELPEGLLAKARVFVDDAAQSRGIGELQWAPDTACTEIGDVLSGKAVFARGAGDITVFDMTGIALQDLTVARMLEQRARLDGKGQRIAWPW